MSDTYTPEIKRGPGRPPRQEQVQVTRRRREGMGAERGQRLYVPEKMKDPDFVYRHVNARDGRVSRLYEEDWDVVGAPDGDPAANASSLGTTIQRVANQTTGEKTILMRKRKELYEADKAAEQKLLDAQDEAMRRGALPSPEGLNGAESYTPGGKNIIAGR